jgi:HEAT repeat protein
LLLIFILLRRTYRKRYFARRDQRVQFLHDNWEKILNGDIPIRDWFTRNIDRTIVEEILMERIANARADEIRPLQDLARRSGLMENRVGQVRHGRGWTRRLALIALGRMQLPESIPALSEALHDRNNEIVVDAIRSLGQIGTPEAARPILQQISQKPHQYPQQVLQAALANCYRSDLQMLLLEVMEAKDDLRPVLARSLAEVATDKLSGDLMRLATDSLAEVRACAARIIAAAKPAYALNILSLLAGDSEWFVRLRAAVAIGDLGEKRGIPLLVNALCDRNRFVRLRAASELLSFRGEESQIIHLAVQTEDRYALQALISEFQRSRRLPEMVNNFADKAQQPAIESVVLTVLQNGFAAILTDMLFQHPDVHVRKRLARLLAKSGESILLAYLQQMNLQELDSRQRKLLHWVTSQLENKSRFRDTFREAVSA